MATVTFIWHDCFVVETSDAVLVFDYWLDADGENRPYPTFLGAISPDKPLYVFVSHGHKDHFNTNIFYWSQNFENIHYFVSKDIGRRIRHILSPTSVYSGPKTDESRVSVMRAGEFYSDGVLNVHAFPSTDIGISYLAETKNERIFHAGDLNAWLWLDESTEQEIKKAMGDYKACLRDIKTYIDSPEAKDLNPTEHIDYCFFPVDSRIGRDYYNGAKIFVREFNIARFFPMHFDLGDSAERRIRREDAIKFNKYANLDRGEYIPLVLNGSSYISGV